jgi:dTDP-4-dehydrorhamnose 3,5-epimerase
MMSGNGPARGGLATMTDEEHAPTIPKPSRDRQTVTPEGESVQALIAGVRVRRAITHEDDRGSVCEMLGAGWDFDDAPIVYAYQATIRPRKIKGWVVHFDQDDRLFFSSGSVQLVLYDGRPNSETHGTINELFFSEYNRALVRIPRGVYHALRNIGETDALFVNLPTRPYNHVVPDKYRLPLDTEAIPYRFTDRLGG